MKKALLTILAALLALQGCSNKEDNFAYWAKEVNVSTVDNSLRAKVTVSLKEDCTYSIRYWKEGDESTAKFTAPQKAGKGDNITTLKFLYPQTDYIFRIIVDSGAESKDVPFRTGALPADIPQYTVESTSEMDSPLPGLLMQWDSAKPGYVTFCDYDGNIVWYQSFGQGIRTAWLDPDTGRLAVMAGFKTGENMDFQRLVDEAVICTLDGDVVFRRKAGDGFISNLHHEFKLLPDGSMMFVHNVLKDYDLRSRGADTPLTQVWGDGFVVCDSEGKIQKTWDCFDELDPVAVDYINPVKTAEDYVHANSVEIDSDGNYYMTFNRISELWKIDGSTGDILYRLGRHGDIDLTNGEMPSGGLHAATALEPDLVLCYDNGSDRGYSKGVLYRIDPVAKTATCELEIKLPEELSSKNRSNFQKINDDLYLCCSTVSGKAVFTDSKGNIRRVISRSGISYRAYYFENL